MLKIKTDELQTIVSKLRVIKENKLLMITSYWHIFADGEGCEFTAYDGNTYIKIYGTFKGDLDVIVKAEQFAKLVDKTSSEHVTLDFKGQYLAVKGNGNYRIDVISADEEYPDFQAALDEEELADPFEVSPEMFDEVVSINDSSVSKSGSDGVLQHYLFSGKQVITTDSFKVCVNPIEDAISIENVLLDPRILDAISIINEESADIYYLSDERIYVESDNILIFATLPEGVENYPDVSAISDSEFVNTVSLPTANVRNIIDRLSLFVTSFDNNIINLKFTPAGLVFETNNSSNENVNYREKATGKLDFICSVNSQLLSNILSPIGADRFNCSFGNESVINFESNGINYYLALAEEE